MNWEVIESGGDDFHAWETEACSNGTIRLTVKVYGEGSEKPGAVVVEYWDSFDSYYNNEKPVRVTRK